MKVLYLSNPVLFDHDLSLIKHLRQECEVIYLLDLPPTYYKRSALDLRKPSLRSGIFKAELIDGLDMYTDYIPLSDFYVIRRSSNKFLSFSNIRLQTSLNSFVKKQKPDVVHCGNLLNRHFIYFLFRNKIPMVLTVHDPVPRVGEDNRRNRIIRHINYSKIKNIVLLNKEQKELFVTKNKGYHFKDLMVSSLGIYEYLKEYPHMKNLKKNFNILFFGRITRYKGIDLLLQAFDHIKKQLPNARLTIAGPGKFWFDTKPYYKDPKITLINRYIPNSELAQLIRDASLVVCPYIDASQSGVVMSAYALGKPVLATDTGGMASYVEHGITGHLVPSNDLEALENALTELIDHPETLSSYVSNIQKRYMENNDSWRSISSGLTSFYAKM